MIRPVSWLVFSRKVKAAFLISPQKPIYQYDDLHCSQLGQKIRIARIKLVETYRFRKTDLESIKVDRGSQQVRLLFFRTAGYEIKPMSLGTKIVKHSKKTESIFMVFQSVKRYF